MFSLTDITKRAFKDIDDLPVHYKQQAMDMIVLVVGEQHNYIRVLVGNTNTSVNVDTFIGNNEEMSIEYNEINEDNIEEILIGINGLLKYAYKLATSKEEALFKDYIQENLNKLNTPLLQFQ